MMAKAYNGLILLAVVAVIVLAASGNFDFPGAIGGTSANLALTSAEYVPVDSFFLSSAYILNFHSAATGASAAGTFIPVQVAALTGGESPTDPFTVTFINGNQTCTYNIDPNPMPVYNLYEKSTEYIYTPHETECCLSTITKPFCDVAYCQNVLYQHRYGDAYLIIQSPTYKSTPEIELESVAGTYSSSISPLTRQGDISGIFTATMAADIPGSQNCPLPEWTLLFKPKDSDTMKQADKGISSYNYFNYIKGVASNIEKGYTASYSYYGNYLKLFTTSTSNIAQFCQNPEYIGASTKYVCMPSTPFTLPDIGMSIKANILGIEAPYGVPDVTGFEAAAYDETNVAKVNSIVKNIGTDSDTFKFSVTGAHPFELPQTQAEMRPAETIQVPLFVQGPGLIATYYFTAASAVKPEVKDTMGFRLLIEPECAKGQQSGKIRIGTEYGCEYVCPSALASPPVDEREKTCQPFGSFEVTHTAYNAGSVKYPEEYHCTGMGTYDLLNDYMADVLSGKLEPILPAKQAHAFWLPAPYCNYVGEWGYYWDGTRAVYIVDEAYSGETPPEGIYTDIPGPKPPSEPSTPEIPTDAPPDVIINPPDDGGIVPGIDNSWLLIIVAIVAAYYLTKKK